MCSWLLRNPNRRGTGLALVEIALLRSHPLFSMLRAPVLESLARELTSIELSTGECLIREGQTGERYYVVAGGRLEVSQARVPINSVGRGVGVERLESCA